MAGRHEETSRGGRLRLMRWTIRAAAVVIAALSLYLVLTAFDVWSASNADDSTTDEWKGASGDPTAIVVLGAAQYDGRPSPVLAARLDHAVELREAGVGSTIVVTGYKQDDDRFTEAYAGLKYLMSHGVPESDVLVVDDGSNTWESLSAVNHVLSRRGVERVMLVSTRYHNQRLLAIAAELGLHAGVSSVGQSASVPQIIGETARVAVGRVIGYRRLSGLTS